MNILIIHGDDTYNSYKKYLEYITKVKEKNWKIRYLSDNGDFQETLSENSLFKEKSIYILKNITAIKKTNLENLLKNIDKNKGNIIIYENKLISQNILKRFNKKKKTLEYKLPFKIYKLMELFYPNNEKEFINTLNDVLINSQVEFIFNMLSRHIRDLYWFKISGNDMPYPEWKIQKLKKQADKFKEIKLKDIIKNMSLIDIKVKTSKSKLIDELELLILKDLT